MPKGQKWKLHNEKLRKLVKKEGKSAAKRIKSSQEIWKLLRMTILKAQSQWMLPGGGSSSKGRKRVVQLNSRVREVVRTRRHPSNRCRHAQIEKVERILNFGIVNIKTQ